jgi:excisionase family DNA binding protein
MKEVMNVKEVAKYLNCSESCIRKLKREQKIPFFRVATKLLFYKEKIDKWLSETEVVPTKTSLSNK